jgi:hypothetical protein
MSSAFDEITHHGQIDTLDKLKAFQVAANSRISARKNALKFTRKK